MRKTLIPIVIVLVFLFIGLPQVFFVIDETELAIVTRFGAFQKEYTEPGLKVKTPIIDNVQRLITNWLLMDGFSVGLGDCYISKTQKDKII